MNERNRIDYIDALRCFAIVAVIINHTGSAMDVSGTLRSITNFGAYGVQLFFIVSAFTIFLTFDRSVQTERHPTRNFLIRRLFRIVPVYWAGILVYAAVFGSASRGWLPGPEWWHYPVHALLLNVLVPNATSSVVPGGWSISLEVLFYLSAPLWFALVTTTRRALVFTVASAALGTAVLALAPDVGQPVDSLYWYRSPIVQLPCFGAGMLLFFLTRGTGWRFNIAATALAGVALLYLSSRVRGIPDVYLVVPGFTLLALALSKAPIRAVVNRLSTSIGRSSYSAYLLHFLVIQTVLRTLGVAPDGDPLAFAGVLALTMVVTLLAAQLSHRIFERFWISQARRIVERLEGREARPVPAPAT